MILVLDLHIFDVIYHHVDVSDVCHGAVHDLDFKGMPLSYVCIQDGYGIDEIFQVIFQELSIFT